MVYDTQITIVFLGFINQHSHHWGPTLYQHHGSYHRWSRLGFQVITVMVEALAEFAKNCKHTDSWKIYGISTVYGTYIWKIYGKLIWKTGWWFGTFGLFFHNIWKHHPNWLSYFSEGLKPWRKKGQQLFQFDTYHYFFGTWSCYSKVALMYCTQVYFAPILWLGVYYDLEL